jgi:hypothetical protein
MKLTRSGVVIAVMAGIIAVLAWALVYYARDEFELQAEGMEEEIPTASTVGTDGGYSTVGVSPESQKATGIETARLEVARGQATAEVYGTVVDLHALFDLRGRYLAAVSEARGLLAIAENSRGEYERVRSLYEDDRNVAERTMLAAQAQWKSDAARVLGTQQSAASLRDTLRSAWGPVVSGWAVDADSEPFEVLADQRQVLVQVTFPFDLQAQAGRAPLSLGPVSARGAQRPARFVSASPQTDATLPGATYFFVTGGQGLRAGMRLAGRIALGDGARDGVLVPETAVLWHGGAAWVYVKAGDDTFVRRPVDTAQEFPGGGWFNAEGFEAGEEVVVRGAQLLLSEELKFQIRNENED